MPPLDRGDRIGRYLVLSLLGRGGMGVVYSAYDPDLDRKVALKLLRPRFSDDESSASSRERLVREAQALAQLSHPNVITVFDVGDAEDGVFIAMELVEGQTLSDWAKQATRTTDEIVSCFAEAGRGLAAAHDAGLVHRDFKPKNVMISATGKVKVLDFGLARPVDRGTGSDELSTGEESTDSHTEPLTRAGAVVGTAPYMAPELYRRQDASAASDQYSFGLSLYEVLFGERPYPGRTLRELKRHVLAGELPIPDRADVPGELVAIVRRALALSPTDRYPSMHALLADLGRDRRAERRRWWTIAGGGALVAGAALAVALAAGPSPEARCDARAADMRDVWNPGAADAVKQAFVGTGIPYAGREADRLQTQIDGYAENWSAMRVEACKATRVASTQSEELLDLRMECLDRRRDALAEVVGVLHTDVDATAVERAATLVDALPELDVCADAPALRAAYPPPDNAETRAEVERIRRELERVSATATVGRYQQALAPAEELAGKARALGYPPMIARTEHTLAVVEELAGHFDRAAASYQRALRAAANISNGAQLAQLWVEYIDLLGTSLERHEQALTLVEAAEVALAEAGDDPVARAELLGIEGAILDAKGEFPAARNALERALELLEQTDARPTLRATTLGSLANTLKMQGQYAAAREYLQRARALFVAAVGPEHPKVGAAVFNAGLNEMASGDCRAALELFEEARQITESSFGPNHPHVAVLLSETANCMTQTGQLELAEKYQRRALRIREQALGPDHSSVGFSLQYLGDVLARRQRYDEARSYLERALSLREATLGPAHPNVGESVAAIAELLWNQGRPAEARPYYQRTTEIYAAVYGDRHPFYAIMLLNIGEIDLELGQIDSAVDLLERSVAILGAAEGSPTRLADAESVLARALWAAGKRSRARALAKKSQDVYAEAGDSESADDLGRWLAQHR